MECSSPDCSACSRDACALGSRVCSGRSGARSLGLCRLPLPCGPREAAMNLTPREKDKLLVATAAMVARRRLERGVKLNYPEAVALITDFVVEGARDGVSVAALMRDGAGVVRRDQVMEGVAE